MMHSGFQFFLRGIASTLDLFGTLYHDESMKILKRTDAEALASDWEAVGNNMKHAMAEYNRSQ